MNYWYIVLFSTTIACGGSSLLHNRTMQRNAKQQLDILLAEIGAPSVEDALEKVRRLPELLEMLHVPTVPNAFNVLHERGTQEQVVTLLKTTGAANLADVINKVKGLPDLFSSLGASTATQAKKKVNSIRNDASAITSKMQKLEARYADLEMRHNALINQCKRIEKEFSRVGTS